MRTCMSPIQIGDDMSMPQSVTILGYKYAIGFEDSFNEGKDTMGSCNSMKQKILINEKCCMQQQQSTLLHEIIEALNYHLELDLEHSTIMGLETGLYQTLKENKLVFHEK